MHTFGFGQTLAALTDGSLLWLLDQGLCIVVDLGLVSFAGVALLQFLIPQG